MTVPWDRDAYWRARRAEEQAEREAQAKRLREDCADAAEAERAVDVLRGLGVTVEPCGDLWRVSMGSISAVRATPKEAAETLTLHLTQAMTRALVELRRRGLTP